MASFLVTLQLVHRLNNAARQGLHRERVFRDISHPFEIELFTKYWFCHADIMDLVGDSILVAERKGSVTPTLAL